VEPLAFGGLVVAVLLLAAKGRDFSDILPNLGVMALAGYRLLPSLQLLYSQLTQVSSMRHAVDEVYDEFVAVETDRSISAAISSDVLARAKPFVWNDAIALREISFRYPGVSRPALDGISLIIAKNTSLGVIGPTGSGKSTLVDLLLGLYQPAAGEILIDGRPLAPALVPAWQASIGYVPQDIFLIDDTIARNVAFGLPEDEIDPGQLREACATAQILYFIETELRDGFDTIVGERGIRLSGGQRQRIGLARALYHRPSLLILDEATSALDMATEAKLLDALRGLAGKLTMVVAAHRVSAVANCDQLVDLTDEAATVAATTM
jgi:ABC-type multidrug transport system fused ATPase/permease subunit